MRKKSMFCRLTLGLLIVAMIMPAQPAQAQFGFGGIVFDPRNFGENVRKRIEDSQRFSQMFDNAVKQYTTLRGVLGGVEDMVAKQKNAINTMANIGRTVRGSLQLKDQVESIITTRLTMLKSIDDRLRRGIFDPEADLRDLEDYLRTSIGRSSQNSVANLERLLKMDNTLERMDHDLKKAQGALSAAAAEKITLKLKLDEATSKPESERDMISIGILIKKIADNDILIAQLTSEIEKLRSKIEERTQLYNVLMDERVRFAEQVGATNRAWTEFNDTLDKIQKTLNEN